MDGVPTRLDDFVSHSVLIGLKAKPLDCSMLAENECLSLETGGSFVTGIPKETRMSSYHPDWVGALTAGVGIGLSLLVGARVWPQQDRRMRVMFIAVAIGVALAIAARTLMRRFGI
jgi:hypothetical protein